MSSDPNRVVLWAIAATAFFGFFRLGELLPDSAKSFSPTTHLAWGDVAVNSRTNPRMVQIHLKRSKCDQFGSGADIILGRTGVNLCPVTSPVHQSPRRSTRVILSGLLLQDNHKILVCQSNPQHSHGHRLASALIRGP